jgi:hypothetical protein
MGRRSDVSPRKKTAVAVQLATLRRGSSRLGRGQLAAVAKEHDISPRLAAQISKEAGAACLAGGAGKLSYAAKRKGQTFRPSTITGATLEAVLGVPVSKRFTCRAWAQAAGLKNHVTLYRWANINKAKRMARRIKPLLSDHHKLERVGFTYSMSSRVGAAYTYEDMHDVVHVDEKWFYVVKDGQGCYILPCEVGVDGKEPRPPRVQHKSHITKVMFLCAVARPRLDHHGRRLDGKIGLWPIVETAAAAKRSKHRAAGTLITKPLSVTAGVYERLMIDKVLPAVATKLLPHVKGSSIRIQQDGARPHTAGGLVARIEAAALATHGMQLILETQPAQSPDLNLCDLSIFASLQARQQQVWTTTVDGLIKAVGEVWDAYDWQSVERAWFVLFGVYDLILEHKGDNGYKLPHNGVRKRQQAGLLPHNAPANAQNVRAAAAFLRSKGALG